MSQLEIQIFLAPGFGTAAVSNNSSEWLNMKDKGWMEVKSRRRLSNGSRAGALS